MDYYLAFLFVTLAALSTSVASAVHGANYVTKGLVMAVHCLIVPTVAPFFWLFFRGHKQAKAELDIIAGHGSFEEIRRAYPLWFGRIIGPAIRWGTQNHSPHFDPSSNGKRMQQELTGGLIAGFLLALPTAVLIIAQ